MGAEILVIILIKLCRGVGRENARPEGQPYRQPAHPQQGKGKSPVAQYPAKNRLRFRRGRGKAVHALKQQRQRRAVHCREARRRQHPVQERQPSERRKAIIGPHVGTDHRHYGEHPAQKIGRPIQPPVGNLKGVFQQQVQPRQQDKRDRAARKQAVVLRQPVPVRQPPGRHGGDRQSGGVGLPRRKLFHGDSSFPLFAMHSNFTVMEKPFVHFWKLRSLPAWNIRYTPPLALVPISCFLRCTGWFEKPKSGQPAQYIMIFLA